MAVQKGEDTDIDSISWELDLFGSPEDPGTKSSADVKAEERLASVSDDAESAEADSRAKLEADQGSPATEEIDPNQCWGALLVHNSSSCTPGYQRGSKHQKNKFCDNCRKYIVIPAERVRALDPSDHHDFANSWAGGVWARHASGFGYRVINHTALCHGPRLIIFEDDTPPNIGAPLLDDWIWEDGNVQVFVSKGTLVPLVSPPLDGDTKSHMSRENVFKPGQKKRQREPNESNELHPESEGKNEEMFDTDSSSRTSSPARSPIIKVDYTPASYELSDSAAKSAKASLPTGATSQPHPLGHDGRFALPMCAASRVAATSRVQHQIRTALPVLTVPMSGSAQTVEVRAAKMPVSDPVKLHLMSSAAAIGQPLAQQAQFLANPALTAAWMQLDRHAAQQKMLFGGVPYPPYYVVGNP